MCSKRPRRAARPDDMDGDGDAVTRATSRPTYAEVLASVADRYLCYRRASIPTIIADCDDTLDRRVSFAQGVASYVAIGESAMDVIAQAMLATRRTTFGSVLDHPCGGGCVTRHLCAFLPEAQRFVGELAPDKLAFTTRVFDATPVDAGRRFECKPERSFDLIFVGSLLTRLSVPLLSFALRWFLAALADDGVLIVTTQSRRHDSLQGIARDEATEAQWAAAVRMRDVTGIGFVSYERGGDYGVSLCSPAWLARQVEAMPGVQIAMLQEAAWNDHQDVMVLHRKPMKCDVGTPS
jgi:hypothetical protein